jgi:hypothetical protein
MSTPLIVHHVDYRSKAKERQAELDDLRKQSLAKPKGEFLVFVLVACVICRPVDLGVYSCTFSHVCESGTPTRC